VKIILTVECDGPGELEEARQFVAALAVQAQRGIWNGLPGVLLERDDAPVWVTGAALVEGEL
jgi:hypothetical protein